MLERCDECRFAPDGKCHRFPPVPLVGAGNVQPIVQPDGWCGEFEAPGVNRACDPAATEASGPAPLSKRALRRLRARG